MNSRDELKTGVVVHGDDWPGLYISGKNAAVLLLAVKHVIDVHVTPEGKVEGADPASLRELRALMGLLMSVDPRNDQAEVTQIFSMLPEIPPEEPDA